MQAVAAEFPGCAEKFYCFQERRVLNTLFSIHLFSKSALKQTRSVFKGFLTRNERLD